MIRPDFYREFTFLVALLAVLGQASCACHGETPERPNIVWIMSEDNSADYLKHFDPAGAVAPNIEAMAAHGVTFDRAFSNAPVCSVARTTLITSCYAPRIGTQFHRRHFAVPMPEGLQMFPAYLLGDGYYTTNNSKEDYNAIKGSDVWSESSKKASWTKRPNQETPFFHVQTFADSHESRLHFTKKKMEQNPTQTDPSTVALQPYFPDTPLMRYTRAYYLDRMKVIDERVGSVLDQLRDAGELENTFVFYFGDHGGVLPRSKGYAYEAGLHVPLVIRVPENFRELADRELGSRTRGFVEFVDFGPTVLALAGVEVPEGIDGKPFMGVDVDPEKVDARDETLGYADRFDEKYDLVRTLRIGNLKYIRNFEPFYPDALQNNYRYKALAYQQWRKMFEAGELSGPAAQFFEPKSAEALYDLDSDPHEVNNLAADPKYQSRLLEMRAQLEDRLKSLPDLSFITEGNVVDAAIGNPVNFGQANIGDIARYIDTVNLALLPLGQATVQLERALNDNDPWVRYWALVACSTLGKDVESLVPLIEDKLTDTEPLVVVRAVEYMAMFTDVETNQQLYRSLERATIAPEALRMMNSVVFLRDFHNYQVDTNELKFHYVEVTPKGELMRRLQYLRGELDPSK